MLSHSSRRNFLRALVGAAAAAPALDLDRLLWVPGARTISIPASPTIDRTFDVFFVMREVYWRFPAQYWSKYTLTGDSVTGFVTVEHDIRSTPFVAVPIGGFPWT